MRGDLGIVRYNEGENEVIYISIYVLDTDRKLGQNSPNIVRAVVRSDMTHVGSLRLR